MTNSGYEYDDERPREDPPRQPFGGAVRPKNRRPVGDSQSGILADPDCEDCDGSSVNKYTGQRCHCTRNI